MSEIDRRRPSSQLSRQDKRLFNALEAIDEHHMVLAHEQRRELDRTASVTMHAAQNSACLYDAVGDMAGPDPVKAQLLFPFVKGYVDHASRVVQMRPF